MNSSWFNHVVPSVFWLGFRGQKVRGGGGRLGIRWRKGREEQQRGWGLIPTSKAPTTVLLLWSSSTLFPFLMPEDYKTVKFNNANGESTPEGNNLTGPLGNQSPVWGGLQGGPRRRETPCQQERLLPQDRAGSLQCKRENTWLIEGIKTLVLWKNTEVFFC